MFEYEFENIKLTLINNDAPYHIVYEQIKRNIKHINSNNNEKIGYETTQNTLNFFF